MRVLDVPIEERLAAELLPAYRAALARLAAFDEHRQPLLQIPMPVHALVRRKHAYLIDRELLLKPLIDLVAVARPPAVLNLRHADCYSAHALSDFPRVAMNLASPVAFIWLTLPRCRRGTYAV
jgi:hypothetical protein